MAEGIWGYARASLPAPQKADYKSHRRKIGWSEGAVGKGCLAAAGLFPPGWKPPPLRPTLQPLGLEVGALLLGSSFFLPRLLLAGDSHMSKPSPPGRAPLLSSFRRRILPTSSDAVFFFFVMLYKHIDDIVGEIVGFEQVEPSYSFQKETYFIIIRWQKKLEMMRSKWNQALVDA